MSTSKGKEKANLARMKKVMEEIEKTTDDFDLIKELHELLTISYPSSLKWHIIVFKNEVDKSLWYLEDIRREELEIEKMNPGQRIGSNDELSQVSKFSEILNAFRFGHKMVYDTESSQYKLSKLKASRITRSNVFEIPKSMIGDGKLQWSEAVKQKWGEDTIGQRESLERGICN